ncbi:hypothetical protein [Streptococcus timonensis]|uniref:hypothetical protein n=1 Tax=Streptococcus timonensis TaxID=1852387 RepID=UPI0039C3513B
MSKRYILRNGDMFHMNGKFNKRPPVQSDQDPIRLLGGFSLYQLASNTQGWVDWLGLSQKLTKGIVYRMGSATDNTLTQRPGKDTLSGLSTSMDKPTGKCQAIDVSKLEKSGLEAINDHGNHVSIRPINDPGFIKLKEWAYTRGTDVTHSFTQAVKNAIIK